MKIHPTAIVAEAAKLADDVEIGPYSVISAESVIGPGCVIGAHVVLEHRVRIGDGTKVGHGTILGADPQDLGFDTVRTDTGVLIGKDNVIREYTTINRATKEGCDTVVGDRNFLMTGFHMGHDSVVGSQVIAANNVLLAGHVRVQDRAFLGGGTVFHQFMQVGTLAMARGGCRFSKDIPPFLVATGENHVAGINSIGLRRAGLSAHVRTDIKRAFRLLYQSGLNVSQALDTATGEDWGAEATMLFDFVRQAKKRGICDYIGKGTTDEE